MDTLALFVARLPTRPYCSDNKTASLIRTKTHALRRTYIQHNSPVALNWLVFDVDIGSGGGPPALRWEAAGLPAPAWVAGREDGGAHIAYGLRTPVALAEASRIDPLRYAAAIEGAYRDALGADEGYAGLLTKNPTHPAWRVWLPAAAANGGIYDLGELAEFVDLTKKRKRRREATGIGRNVELFDRLRLWAYRAVRSYWAPAGYARWHTAVLERAESYNDFSPPLPTSEVKATAKSVSNWTWKHITPGGFREAQAARGRRSGTARRAASEDKRSSARLMAAQGLSTRAIAAELRVNQSTVARWLRDAG